MARIWFSVCGDGNGHALRSSVLLDYLKGSHEILITASLRAYPYLKERYDNVHRIEGFSFVYEKNSVNIQKTFDFFSKHFLEYQSKNFKILEKLLFEFKPQIIISDFEPTSHWYNFGLPIINIDNINILSRGLIEVSHRFKRDLAFAQTFIRTYFGNIPKTPKHKYFLIPTFTFPKVKSNTKLFMPLLRQKVLDMKTSEKDHILVYQTTDTNKKLIPILKKLKNEKFIVYGFDKKQKTKNIIFKKFNGPFLNDLASSKAVIVNGGHNVICESLYFGKPVLALPIKNQFEQLFNGISLNTECFGTYIFDINQNIIESFINNIPFYKKTIEKKLKKWDNRAFFREIDAMIKKHRVKDPKIFSIHDKLMKIQKNIFKTSKKYISLVDKTAFRFFKKNGYDIN